MKPNGCVHQRLEEIMVIIVVEVNLLFTEDGLGFGSTP